MQFDLVVNILTAKAHAECVIPIFDGDRYRTNSHIRDAARVYTALLNTLLTQFGHEVVNIGSDIQMYHMGEIGEIISECFS